jgi:phosphate transport system substrate-binding protein
MNYFLVFILVFLPTVARAQSEQQPQSNDSIQTIRVGSSSNLAPFIKEAARRYAAENKSRIVVLPTGTSGGRKCPINHTCEVGVVTQNLTSEEKSKLKVAHLGWDGIVIVANKDVQVENLSSEQLKKVLRGDVKNWKEIGGSDLPLKFFTRNAASKANLEGFFDIKLKGEETPNQEASYNRVKATPGSITHLSLSLALSAPPGVIKIISIDGQTLSFDNLKSNTYRLRKEISLVQAVDQANSSVDAFVQFLIKGRKEIFGKADFLME